MNWGHVGVNPATMAREPTSAVQSWIEKGLVVGRFLVVEPTGLEPVTPCLQRGGITGQEVRSALIDPHLDRPGRVECWHRCCTWLLYLPWYKRV